MKKRVLTTLVVAATFILSVIIFIYLLELFNFKCIFKSLFNIYCAGCGTTRMIKEILKLNIYGAFRYNPFMFILFIFFIFYFIYKIYIYIKKGSIKVNCKLLIIISVLLIIYMVLRNIPVFEFLKPIKIK